MKRLLFMTCLSIVLLGAGCNNSSATQSTGQVIPSGTSAGTSSNSDQAFEHKTKCAPFIDAKNKELIKENTDVFLDNTYLEMGCYSKMYNTCVAILNEPDYSSSNSRQLTAYDLLSNNSIATVKFLNKLPSDEFGNLMEENYKIRADFDASIGCEE